MENDNLSEKIEKLLSDPDSMSRIQEMAQSLFGGEEKTAPAPESAIGGDEMGMLMKVASMLKSDRPDERAKLLLALKPHLSHERSERVDRAVKLLRLASLLPLLGETDLFKL